MAFSFTILERENFGRKRVLIGTFTNTDSSTGGDISLSGELHRVNFFIVQIVGAAVGNAVTVNETLPCGDAVTIVTEADRCGVWMAIGE